MIVSGLSDCPFTGEDRRRQEKTEEGRRKSVSLGFL
jgi:hypothetical protein